MGSSGGLEMVLFSWDTEKGEWEEEVEGGYHVSTRFLLLYNLLFCRERANQGSYSQKSNYFLSIHFMEKLFICLLSPQRVSFSQHGSFAFFSCP